MCINNQAVTLSFFKSHASSISSLSVANQFAIAEIRWVNLYLARIVSQAKGQMADSAPTTPAEWQSVGAHHRIGMRRVAQLALPRAARTNFVNAAFLLLPLFGIVTAESTQVRFSIYYLLFSIHRRMCKLCELTYKCY